MGDTTPAMERRLISGHSPFEPVAGFSRAVVAGSTVYVAGTAPIPPDGSPTPESAYEQARLCLAIIADALERAGASVEDVVRTRMFVTDAAHWSEVALAHGEVFADVRPAATCVVTSLLDPAWKVEIEAEAVLGIEQAADPAGHHGQGRGRSRARAPACSTTRFGKSDPYTLGVEEEYQLLDGTSFDLVQHIDTVLAAIAGHELEPQINPELMQSVLEIATPVCHTPGRRDAGARQAPRLRLRGRAREGAARRLGGHASVQPLRAPADHGEGPLPPARRPAAVHRAPRAHLRDAHPRRDRRSREGDQGDERPPAPARAAARALGELAVLARRADRADVEPADGVRVVPALGPAAALPRLRGLRRGRRPARAHRLHRRLHAHLVGHPSAPAARHDRDPDLRRRHAGRGRRRDHRLLPGARQAALRALRRRRGDPHLPPHPHDREQVARRPLRARGAGDGPRDRAAQPDPDRASSCGGR